MNYSNFQNELSLEEKKQSVALCSIFIVILALQVHVIECTFKA